MLFAGIMSGTSMDGADAIVADFSGTAPRVLGFASAAYAATLKAELLDLNSAAMDEVARAALASYELAAVYAQALQAAT